MQEGKPFGKLNCTNVEEVIHSNQAVIGTLNISTYPGKVLFDTGATTSFISREFIDAYGMRCDELAYPLTILSAGGIILVTHIRKQQVLMICGNE
jgi:predicted aspartyl protease